MKKNMSEQALNYCTQAIEGLIEGCKVYRETAPITYINHHHIINLLRDAVKFNLPDNGKLFDSGLAALPVVFRLPFPVTACEFRITQEAPVVQQPLYDEGLHQSSKRISLAVEITEKNLDDYRWLMPPSQKNLVGSDGSILIIPVYYIDSTEKWQFPPFGGLIAASHVTVSPDEIAKAKHVYGGAIPKGMTSLPIVLKPIRLMPEICDSVEINGGMNHVLATVTQDTHDEMIAILELIEILSCKNVSTVTMESPKKLNEKRVSNKKTPFFEYKLLVLDTFEDQGLKNTGTNSHMSPRVHLRRGHIRRLPTKNVWINAAVVGSKQAGSILKDYAVKNG